MSCGARLRHRAATSKSLGTIPLNQHHQAQCQTSPLTLLYCTLLYRACSPQHPITGIPGEAHCPGTPHMPELYCTVPFWASLCCIDHTHEQAAGPPGHSPPWTCSLTQSIWWSESRGMESSTAERVPRQALRRSMAAPLRVEQVRGLARSSGEDETWSEKRQPGPQDPPPGPGGPPEASSSTPRVHPLGRGRLSTSAYSKREPWGKD